MSRVGRRSTSKSDQLILTQGDIRGVVGKLEKGSIRFLASKIWDVTANLNVRFWP